MVQRKDSLWQRTDQVKSTDDLKILQLWVHVWALPTVFTWPPMNILNYSQYSLEATTV